MLNNKTIAVVVPAYNEEKQIGSVIQTMPTFVDKIIVVNDCSKDNTAAVVRSYWHTPLNQSMSIENQLEKEIVGDYNSAGRAMQKQSIKELELLAPSVVENVSPEAERIILISLQKNRGVGAAVARGYKWCKDYAIDCVAKVDGDGQMDPDELENICRPVVDEGIDYVKGNRLIHRSAFLVIPKMRYFGNSILSILTKIASGYWHVSDTQTAFTAISNKAINAIRLQQLYRKYGYPNDILVKLNIAFCTIKEVEIKPVYGIGERSKMKLHKVIPRISWLLFKSFFKRLWIKYLFRDFHPLFILYHLSFILSVIWIYYLVKMSRIIFSGANASFETLFAFTFLGVTAIQFLLFAMWMDIQDNERLYK